MRNEIVRKIIRLCATGVISCGWSVKCSAQIARAAVSNEAICKSLNQYVVAMNRFAEAQERLLDETESFNIALNRYLHTPNPDSAPQYVFSSPLAQTKLAVDKARYDSLMAASGILPEPYRANIRRGMDSLNATIGNLFIAAAELSANTQEAYFQQPRRAAIFASLQRMEILSGEYLRCHLAMQKTLYGAWHSQGGETPSPIPMYAEDVLTALLNPAQRLAVALQRANAALFEAARKPVPVFVAKQSVTALLNLAAEYTDSLHYVTPFGRRNIYYYNHRLRRECNQTGIMGAYNRYALTQIASGKPTLLMPVLPPCYCIILPADTRNTDGRRLPEIPIWLR